MSSTEKEAEGPPVDLPIAWYRGRIEELQDELQRVVLKAANSDIDRWAMRDERNAACDRATAAERKVHAVELVQCWTNEDGKRFMFVDDVGAALEIPGYHRKSAAGPSSSVRFGVGL